MSSTYMAGRWESLELARYRRVLVIECGLMGFDIIVIYWVYNIIYAYVYTYIWQWDFIIANDYINLYTVMQ